MTPTHEFAIKLLALANEAGRLNLWRTVRALHEAKKAFGADCDPEYAAKTWDKREGAA